MIRYLIIKTKTRREVLKMACTTRCNKCGGSGKVKNNDGKKEECWTCNGSGRVGSCNFKWVRFGPNDLSNHYRCSGCGETYSEYYGGGP